MILDPPCDTHLSMLHDVITYKHSTATGMHSLDSTHSPGEAHDQPIILDLTIAAILPPYSGTARQ